MRCYKKGWITYQSPWTWSGGIVVLPPLPDTKAQTLLPWTITPNRLWWKSSREHHGRLASKKCQGQGSLAWWRQNIRVPAAGWEWEGQKRKSGELLTNCTCLNTLVSLGFQVLLLCLCCLSLASTPTMLSLLPVPPAGPSVHYVPLDLCLCCSICQHCFQQGLHLFCTTVIPNTNADSWQLAVGPYIGMDK